MLRRIRAGTSRSAGLQSSPHKTAALIVEFLLLGDVGVCDDFLYDATALERLGASRE